MLNPMARYRHTLVPLGLVLLGCVCSVARAAEEFQVEWDLIKHHAEIGSEGSWRPGRACETCPRGVFATKDVPKGDSVGFVQLRHCIPMGASYTSMSSLIMQRMSDPRLNETFAAYLNHLPGPGGAPSFMTMHQHADMLQSEQLASQVKSNDALVKDATEFLNSKLNWTVPEELTRHYMSLVATRAFGFRVGPELQSFMCPILDLVNYNLTVNAKLQQRGHTVHVVALRDIAKDEEVFWEYQQNMNRPDMQLLAYGFVQDQADPPLSSIDVNDTNARKVHGTVNPKLEDDITKLSDNAASAELRRVQAILQALPTSEEEDRKALASGRYKDDPIAQLILRWRVLRKLALANRIERLKKKLLGELEEGHDEL